MGRIQSSVGLFSGLPIVDLVDQLLAFSARPRELLVQRNEQLRAQRVAITELTAMTVAVQFSIQKLGKSELFARKTVTSSDESLISTEVTGTPAAGTFQVTPVRRASTHQLLSSGMASQDEPLGEGEISLRFGGQLDQGLSLEHINGGQGVERGKIRVTDRSGASTLIDLRFAQTIDDVVDRINTSDAINVTASMAGDRIRLTDHTGQTVSNLKVQEVNLGRAAADLGLDSVDVAADEALGDDIVSLFDGLKLDQLNDGNGVYLRQGVADLQVTFADGSAPLDIEFFAQTKGPTVSSVTTTAANGGDAEVTITSVGTGEEWDGYRIVFEDDEEISLGEETVEINEAAKTITFQIDAGNTRAVHIVNALNNDEDASQLFTAETSAQGDGTGRIELSDTGTTAGGAVEFNEEATIGDILATINAADPARLQAQIAADGDGIELLDLTSGGGTFSVSSLFGGSVAEDLGLDVAASGGVISGERRLAGLKTTLLDSLGGGFGLGSLGLLDVTDRSGAAASIDLASAETVEDVLAAINGAGIGVEAGINAARNGIEIRDISGGGGNLVVANGDATGTADALRIAVDDAVSSVNSGSLDRQTFHEQLALSALNNGRGIGTGSFLITDSQGDVRAVNLTVSGAETVGDVIDQINGLSIGVTARINETGDGLLLVDTAGGGGDLVVSDVGSGTVAADLKIAGTSVEQDLDGTPSKVIDGSMTVRITLDSDDTLQDMVDKINLADADVAAGIFNSGSGSAPFRLSLASQITGRDGEMVVDASALGISFHEVSAARDALVMVGPADAAVATALASSGTNEFDSLIDGVTLTVNGSSDQPVTIDIEQTRDPIVSAIDLFVESYNKLGEKLNDLTFFDQETNSAGVLFGSSESLRIETDLARVVSGRFIGTGSSLQSLEEIGLSLTREGQLQFDRDKFKEQYESNAKAVEQLFTHEERGISAQLETVAEQLAGADQSVLINRTLALNLAIDNNDLRITSLNEALEREREALLKQFIRMEQAIGQMQSNVAALSQLQLRSPVVGNLGSG